MARSSSGLVAILCTSGFVDNVMFAVGHNGQEQLNHAKMAYMYTQGDTEADRTRE